MFNQTSAGIGDATPLIVNADSIRSSEDATAAAINHSDAFDPPKKGGAGQVARKVLDGVGDQIVNHVDELAVNGVVGTAISGIATTGLKVFPKTTWTLMGLGTVAMVGELAKAAPKWASDMSTVFDPTSHTKEEVTKAEAGLHELGRGTANFGAGSIGVFPGAFLGSKFLASDAGMTFMTRFNPKAAAEFAASRAKTPGEQAGRFDYLKKDAEVHNPEATSSQVRYADHGSEAKSSQVFFADHSPEAVSPPVRNSSPNGFAARPEVSVHEVLRNTYLFYDKTRVADYPYLSTLYARDFASFATMARDTNGNRIISVGDTHLIKGKNRDPIALIVKPDPVPEYPNMVAVYKDQKVVLLKDLPEKRVNIDELISDLSAGKSMASMLEDSDRVVITATDEINATATHLKAFEAYQILMNRVASILTKTESGLGSSV